MVSGEVHDQGGVGVCMSVNDHGKMHVEIVTSATLNTTTNIARPSFVPQWALTTLGYGPEGLCLEGEGDSRDLFAEEVSLLEVLSDRVYAETAELPLGPRDAVQVAWALASHQASGVHRGVARCGWCVDCREQFSCLAVELTGT